VEKRVGFVFGLGVGGTMILGDARRGGQLGASGGLWGIGGCSFRVGVF
jgi:hypothetical protein